MIEQLQSGEWRVSLNGAFPCLWSVNNRPRKHISITPKQHYKLFNWNGKVSVGDVVKFSAKGVDYSLKVTEVTYLSIKFWNFYLDKEMNMLFVPVQGQTLDDNFILYPFMCKINKTPKA